MKKQKKPFKSFKISYIALLFAIIYSVGLCAVNAHIAISNKAEEQLAAIAHQALMETLKGEEQQAFVHLRRDASSNITAITVNGVLLSQLQIRYLNKLQSSEHTWKMEVPISELLGGRILSWVPGKVTLSCQPVISWEAAVLSRTVELNDTTKQFQLLLTTGGTANWLLHIMDADIKLETIIYETIIYSPNI